jgi:TonB family protein
MAPITKDAENPAKSPSSTAPAPSAPKPADGSTRTQPVALEIPVTVNGARTVEGSDKREPFSESTKTVLIFNQGAVIRIATPVAAGQLVFLTNEKSKKEVVCQVVKSKPGGGPGAGYVELQFTEPAVGFWGMRFPAAPASPAASVLPSTAKAVPPAAPATSKPIAPALSASQPPQPATVPPPPPVSKTETLKPTVAASPPSPAPVSFAPPPAPLPPVAPPAPPEGKQGRGIPEIHDYSKEIAAIFAVPPVGTSAQKTTPSPAPAAVPASSQPSMEELKQQAARLQVQLGSMLFTESTATPPTSATVTAPASHGKSPATGSVASAQADSAQKVSEFKAQDAKPAAKQLPKPVPPAPRSKSYDIDQVEEVKVPDWLAPLSRNAESSPTSTPTPSPAASEQSRIPGWLAPLSHIAPPALAPGASSGTAPANTAAISASPAESGAWNAPYVEPEAESENAPFGETMPDESLESVPEASSAGSSKKGLFLGLAAAALLLAGGGVWYMRQTHGENSSVPTAKKSVEAPVSSQTVAAVDSLPAAKPESAALPAGLSSSSPALSPVSVPPAKNTAGSALSPAPAAMPKNAGSARSPAPAATPKNSAPVARNEAPAEQPKKPGLGQVRLSTPVVSHAGNSQQPGEADTSLGAGVPTPGAESLSSLSAGNTKEPAAPLPVGGDVKQARLLKSVPPVYPPVARTQRIAGNVSIDAVVATDGSVSSVKVLSGPAILHRAALEAVKQWHYEPAMLDGKPTASHLTVIVQFRMQ